MICIECNLTGSRLDNNELRSPSPLRRPISTTRRRSPASNTAPPATLRALQEADVVGGIAPSSSLQRDNSARSSSPLRSITFPRSGHILRSTDPLRSPSPLRSTVARRSQSPRASITPHQHINHIQQPPTLQPLSAVGGLTEAANANQTHQSSHSATPYATPSIYPRTPLDAGGLLPRSPSIGHSVR